ncbi:MAG: hypothetical protein ACPG4X_18685 [Pikeienuella sp.]
MADKVKVKFLVAHVVDDHRKGTKDEESYKAGATATFTAASAHHFVSRGIAERVSK